MKRLIIIILLIVSILFGYIVVTKGLALSEDEDSFSIVSYEDIESESDTMTTAVAKYNQLNDESYPAIIASLSSAISTYEKSKSEYETLVEELSVNEEVVEEETEEEEEVVVTVTPITVYEIDFLWARIGNYAKSNGLTITMSVSKSSSSVASSLGYGLYNLSFNVEGEYIDIANFLYDIEDDDQLGFEIRSFNMTSKTASFDVNNVPINNNTLLENSTTDSTDTTDGSNTTDNDITGTDETDNTISDLEDTSDTNSATEVTSTDDSSDTTN